MRNGQLNKTELATLDKAWGILSELTEWMEENGEEETYEYESAMNAVVGLCEYLGSVSGQ